MATSGDEITIKKKDLELLAKEAGQWALTKEAEDYIDKLALVKDWIEEALEAAKQQIIKDLSKKDRSITTIRGKKYTAFLRTYGDKYETSNPEFQKEISYVRADTERIMSYQKTYHKLPEGTIEKLQTVTCSFRKKT